MIGRRCCEGQVSEQARKLREVRRAAFGPIVEGHLILFSHPTPSKAAKPPKPIPFRV